MAEINQYMLSHTELTELILKHLKVHEGRWVISMNISTTIGVFGTTPEQTPSPGAVVTITQVGVNRVPEGMPAPPGLIVDAARVNPPEKKPKAKK